MSPTIAETYRDVMFAGGLKQLGQALYEPEPDGYDHIRVGDVGYVTRDGDFVRFYNACYERYDNANRDRPLPDLFVPIGEEHRRVKDNLRLDAGSITSHAVNDITVNIETSAPMGGYVT